MLGVQAAGCFAAVSFVGHLLRTEEGSLVTADHTLPANTADQSDKFKPF